MSVSFEQQMLKFNSKNARFSSDEMNELTIYSMNELRSDFGIFDYSKERLVLVNSDSNNPTFKAKIPEVNWLPILRSMSDGVATVTINEMADLLKSRSDLRLFSEIPEELFRKFGQHKAKIAVMHDEQVIQYMQILKIAPATASSSTVTVELYIPPSTIELDLDGDEPERFEMPELSAAVDLQCPKAVNDVMGTVWMDDEVLVVDELRFTLSRALIGMLRLGQHVSLTPDR